jgi:hypothetical protein
MNSVKRIVILLLTLLFSTWNAYGQQSKFNFSGYVKDAGTGEDLIGAVVGVKGTDIGVMTNEYGYYSLTLAEGTYVFFIDYVGYKIQYDTVVLNQNIKKEWQMEVEAEVIELEIKGEREDRNVTDTKISTQSVDINQIKKLPALFGEVDVIKNIQTLPGIQVAGEGNTGLYVRGGGSDQNLILIDEAPVYNASHLLGIFSVFNSDALKSAEIYKGGIPAQYGGRLSSLLDIRTKDGNNKEFHGTGGIGTIAARLTLEGPIVKDKGSFMVSGRRTYGDLFLKLSSDPSVKNNQLYFYDFNAKVNYRINDNNRIYVAGYFGRDVFKFDSLFKIDWGNATGSIRWNHVYSDKLFGNLTFVASDFKYDQDLNLGVQNFNFKTGLREYTLKQDFSHFLNKKMELRYGVSGTQRRYDPGKFGPITDDAIFQEIKIPDYQSLEGSIYLSNNHKISTRISMDYGLRYTWFANTGPGDVYTYNGDVTVANTSDTVTYQKGDIIKSFQAFEPRFAGRYLVNEKSSIKVSYNRTNQFINLIANSLSPLPFNIWVPANPYFKPQYADQIAAGYFRNFKDNAFEASVETYYKNMENTLDFIDNADLLVNPQIETQVRSGRTWSYGLELFLKKNKGKTTGWVSYTLSKTQTQVDEINFGKVYDASFDRRHNLNIICSHDFNKKFNLSGQFVYGTGRPIGLPSSRYEIGGTYIGGLYPERNSLRLPSYHRLDLSFTFNPTGKKPDRKWKGSWVFSVYNLYARRNPFTVYTADKEDSPGDKELRMIYFPAPIPSITYNFSF